MRASQTINLIRKILGNAVIRKDGSVTTFYHKVPVAWVNVYDERYQLILKRPATLSGQSTLIQWDSTTIDEKATSEIISVLKEMRRSFDQKKAVFY